MVYLFFKKVCVGFVGWFFCALLLLKIIVSMKMCYVAVLGYREKYINFAHVLFKSFFLKVHTQKNCARSV